MGNVTLVVRVTELDEHWLAHISGLWNLFLKKRKKDDDVSSEPTQGLHHGAGYHLLQNTTVCLQSRVTVHLQQPHLSGAHEDMDVTHVKSAAANF